MTARARVNECMWSVVDCALELCSVAIVMGGWAEREGVEAVPRREVTGHSNGPARLERWPVNSLCPFTPPLIYYECDIVVSVSAPSAFSRVSRRVEGAAAELLLVRVVWIAFAAASSPHLYQLKCYIY